MLSNVKRFFEPALLDKKETCKSLVGTLINSIYVDILPVIYLPLLITYVQNRDLQKIYEVTIIFVILEVLIFLLRLYFLGWYWYSHRKYFAVLENKYRRIILKKENIFFETTGTGKIQSIVENGLNTWSRTVNDSFWYILRTIVSIILGIFVISQVSLSLFLVFMILIFLSGYFNFLFRKMKYPIDYIQKGTRNMYNSFSVRSIMSRNEVIYSNKISEETAKLYNLKMKEHELGVKSDIYGALSVVPGEIMFLLLPFVGISSYLFLTGELITETNVPIFVSFIYFSSKMSGMVWQLIGFVWMMMENFPDIKRFWELVDSVPEMKNYESGKTFVHGGGHISFENVSFRYENNIVLENLNLDILGGTKTALVGMSGGGKTTIAKLISGYIQTKEGRVEVDGQDLSEVSLKSYYKCVGYLTQDPSVFDGTIKENLLYALDKKDIQNLSEEKVKEILSKAHCDFILNLKKGINTEIGERGIRLSGGERQRLAIAKLFLKNPEIIILDEPTSALDSFSEDKISQSLEELFKGRTTIIIAHRLQTVKSADRILVIENGKVVEDGNHEQLVTKNGVYAQMLKMQSGF